jgi:uncharacterized protein YjlB
MASKASTAVRQQEPEQFRLADDGETPNNPDLPLTLYRGAVDLPAGGDKAAVFEHLFASNGWGKSWRNGIYDFLHFHTAAHEVLGVARGEARVQFGGRKGPVVDVAAGDVVILPAGTGHQRKSASGDLLVVGAYAAGGRYDQHRPGEVDRARAIASIAAVKLPAKHPVYGDDAPPFG